MESLDHQTARAMLEWQIELGVDECILDEPVNRYDLPDKLVKPPSPAVQKGPAAPALRVQSDPVGEAQALAQASRTLDELRAAMAGFDQCELKRGARNLVFADGVAGAPVMIVGEAPGREEDRIGRPFVGAAGHLLDKMFAAIDMGRTNSQAPIYITNTLPWRPPQNRDPKPDEIAMLTPFLLRHVQLADPKVLVVMGNWACQALLGKRGISRLRGTWSEAVDRPALPMFHPAYLLRNPEMKRNAWQDLLTLKAAVDK